MGTNDRPDPHDVVHAALKQLAPTVTMSRDGLVLIGLKHARAMTTAATDYLLADEAAASGPLPLRTIDPGAPIA